MLRKKPFEHSLPYLDISALETGIVKEYTLSDLGTLSNEFAVIVVWDGSRSGLVFKGRHGIIGSTLMNLELINLDTDYFYFFLKSNFKLINGNNVGTGIPHVNSDLFFKLDVPYTTIENQKKIVQKLNDKLQYLSVLFRQQQNLIREALSSTNIEFEKADDMLGAINNFRQAVLRTAFAGQLTNKFRESHRTNIELSKDSNYENFLGEFPIPDTWKWKNLRNIAKLTIGSTPSRGVKNYWRGTIPWISSGEVSNNFIKESREKVSSLAVEEANLKILPKDSILMGMIGEGKTRGQVALLKIDSAINQNICGITLLDDSNPEFLWLYFQFRYEEIRESSNKSRAGSSQTALNSNIIGSFNVCLPPLEEQNEIIKTVRDLFLIAENLKINYEIAVKDLEDLELSILNEAFAISEVESTVPEFQLESIISEIRNKKTIAEEEKKESNKVTSQKRAIMKKQLEINPDQLLKFIKDNFQSSTFSYADLFTKLENAENEYENLKDSIFQLAQEQINKSEPIQHLDFIYDKANHKQLFKLKTQS